MKRETYPGSGWGGMSISDGYKKFVDRDKGLTEDEFKAVVPFCIDNQFRSVSKLLSEGGYYGYLRSQSFTVFQADIKNWTNDQLQKFLLPYLENLTSFAGIVGRSISEKITKWLESGNPADREEELQLFFRQYAKVINYVHDRKNRLQEQIAEKKFATFPE